MNNGYRWVAHQQAVEFLLHLPSSTRLLLIEQLDKLADDPSQETDSSLEEAGGRKLQLKVSGRFIITFWPDHAVKEVRIVAIEAV